MKTWIKITLLTLTVLCIGAYFLLDYRPVKDIPENVIRDADVIWNTYMIDGTGVNYTYNKEREAVGVGNENQYEENPRMALHEESGININMRLEHGHLNIVGGPIDIVKGPAYDYELYGRIVGQWHIPHRLTWDNSYHYSHSDFYLVKRNKNTEQGVVVETWSNISSQYGALQYDHDAGELHIKFCGVENDSITVDVELHNDDKPPLVSCLRT